MVANLDDFKAKTGITVNFQQLANDQLSNKIAIGSAARSKDLDVIAYRPLQETLLFARNGWLEPLDDYIAKSPDFAINDFFKAGRDISLNAAGKTRRHSRHDRAGNRVLQQGTVRQGRSEDPQDPGRTDGCRQETERSGQRHRGHRHPRQGFGRGDAVLKLPPLIRRRFHQRWQGSHQYPRSH